MAGGEHRHGSTFQFPQNDSSSPSLRTRATSFPIKSVQTAHQQLQRLYLCFTLYGAAFLVVGVIAIVLPLIFAISIQQLVIAILLLGGFLSLLHFLQLFGASGTTSFLLLGILHLGIGFWFLLQPSITRGRSFVWILTGWFVIHGLFKTLMACQIRNATWWPVLLASGIISIVLGLFNFSLVPTYGLTLLGLLFGIDLGITGDSFFIISFMAYLESKAKAATEPLLQEHGYGATA